MAALRRVKTEVIHSTPWNAMYDLMHDCIIFPIFIHTLLYNSQIHIIKISIPNVVTIGAYN